MTTDTPQPITYTRQRAGRPSFAQLYGERGRTICVTLPESLLKQWDDFCKTGQRNSRIIEAMKNYIEGRKNV